MTLATNERVVCQGSGCRRTHLFINGASRDALAQELKDSLIHFSWTCKYCGFLNRWPVK